MSGASSQSKTYEVPAGILGLRGPVEKPEPGTLPVRGDLAHIALAGKHLAAHYVIPTAVIVGNAVAEILLMPSDDAETVVTVNAGSRLEILDTEGDWVWACIGPDGPSGYCKSSALAPATVGG